jgi:hypothetical protein
LREEHGGLYVTGGSGRDGGVNRRALAAAAGLCVVIVAWALVNLFVEGMGFPVIDSEKVRGGEEAASALARLFGALVLGLFLHLVIKKFRLDDKYLHIRSYHLQGSRYRLTVGARSLATKTRVTRSQPASRLPNLPEGSRLNDSFSGLSVSSISNIIPVALSTLALLHLSTPHNEVPRCTRHLEYCRGFPRLIGLLWFIRRS